MTKNMIAVLGALAGFAAAAAVHAETVTVNGSTTVLPAMQLTAEGFMKANPNITVTISGTGSGNGIKALRDGMTDVAMASRDMKDKEVKDFADHNIKTVRYTVAHDAIIPVVNPNNAVKGLTMAQLKDIFAGKIRSWDEVGGAKAPIVVVGVQAIAQNPNAIGYIGVGYMDKQTHPLTMNNVKPGIESAKDKTWPIARDLYLFTADNVKAEAKKLIDFMLSAEGQKDVEKAGFVPVAAK